jgi:curli biogenesis system outer membrane secretion channel CsgG
MTIFSSIKRARLLPFLVAASLLGLPALASAAAAAKGEVPFVPGPKRTIAVGSIEAEGGYKDSESWDIGAGVSAMLATELLRSGRFYVAERTQLSEVTREGRIQAEAGGSARNASLTPAQYIVVGSVTEFGSPSKGGGLKVGGSLGALRGLDVSKKKGRVVLDLRLVEAGTAKVIHSFTVTGEASTTGVDVDARVEGTSIGGDQFARTPLGQATREALDDAVIEIARAIANRGWEGRVVTLAGDRVIINAGAEAGVKVGDRFRIERVAEILTDPETGRVLSQSRNTVGDLEVTGIEPEIAHGAFKSIDGNTAPVRGDLAIPLSGIR